MKPHSTAIINFIEDFSLMNSQGVVNFIADIEFKAGQTISRFKSEVFILSVNPKNVDSVNLLNPEITELDFPVMFQSGREVFSYIDNICLMIIGNNAEKGDYVVSVFPDKTQTEARS
ncbi:MAG: hypothetical protein WKI04_12480 [Ferruginibacter sp.]